MSAAALASGAHLLADAWLGWLLLSLRPGRSLTIEHLPAALLLGMYADTLYTGTLVLIGVPLGIAAAKMLLVIVVLSALLWRIGFARLQAWPWARPRWYEVLVLLSSAEKVAFAGWQLFGTPLYFDDALTHWAGRARMLYGGVNWSLDPQSPLWLGFDPHARHYPLLAVVWRAETALVAGQWHDLLARVDSLAFFVAVVATVWLAVLRFSASRWFAAAAAFVVAALPLQAWHAAAGYSDIAVEAYAVAALAALLRREWLLAGVLAAGTAWAKNDGLVVFMPALLLGACLLADRWRQAATFLAGCASLTPWLLLKIWLSLGVAPNQDRFAWRPEALGMILSKVFLGPTSSIVWVGVATALVLCGATLWRERTGRALLAILLTSAAALLLVYAGTEAHVWLINEGTIHRSMLQLSATAIVIAAYAVWRAGGVSPLMAGSRNQGANAPRSPPW